MPEEIERLLQEPRYESRGAFHVAGYSQWFASEGSPAFVALREEAVPRLDTIPGRRGLEVYGVYYNGDGAGGFDYLVGVEVDETAGLTPDLSLVTVPPARYAVFRHDGPAERLGETTAAIWDRWLPQAAVARGPSPEFEVYRGAETGAEGIEIWLPVEA